MTVRIQKTSERYSSITCCNYEISNNTKKGEALVDVVDVRQQHCSALCSNAAPHQATTPRKKCKRLAYSFATRSK